MNALTLNSDCEASTSRIGSDIAMALRPGDLVGLSGALGAGKTVLARAIIRHLASDPALEVPSPAYTLCQDYDTPLPVAHMDLYRIESPEELQELGLQEALDLGCVLIEWPEKAIEPWPAKALLVRISDKGEKGRVLEITGHGSLFDRVLRSLQIRDFLAQNRFGNAGRMHFSADASARAYELITKKSEQFLLMNAPAQSDGPPIKNGRPYSRIAHLAEDVTAFVAVDHALRANGFIAPQIHAADLDAGLLLLQHLGSTGIIDEDRNPVEARYMVAMEFLARLHEAEWTAAIKFQPGHLYQLPSYGPEAMLIEVELLTQWYIPGHVKTVLTPAQSGEFLEIWRQYATLLQAHESSLVLRDFHSPNILWLRQNSGIARVGVIDFQDAVVGPASYDVASLAQDARVDVGASLERRLVEHYIKARKSAAPDFDEEAFKTSYALMAAQRATKILGIFIRLNQRDGKPVYLNHLPRVREYLSRSLKHPALAEYKDWLEAAGALADALADAPD